jgi:hypothetical protein
MRQNTPTYVKIRQANPSSRPMRAPNAVAGTYSHYTVIGVVLKEKPTPARSSVGPRLG